MLSWFSDFIQLIYPNICAACGLPLEKGERCICTQCLADLPFTHFHLYEDNPVAQIFWGRIKIEMGTALLYFHKKGRTQNLLHNLKYKNRKDVGFYLGQLLGNQIKENQIFLSCHFIVPIPLHPNKLKKRGYNQAECFALGISDILNIPVMSDIVVRKIETSTQTKKTRTERWLNVAEAFKVNYSDKFVSKHFLIVDDVVTTGATIEACAQAILSEIPGSKISVAVIAKA
jgi:ComF family protein